MDDTLQLDFAAGAQTRRLQFADADRPPWPSLQGFSQAPWFRESQCLGAFGPDGATTSGALHVRTSNLTLGYLRPNGVPYSEQVVIKECFNVFSLPGDSGTWLTADQGIASNDEHARG